MEELVRQARAGNHDAYAQLVTAHVDRLHATAWLIVRDREWAEDAVQDACLRAWRDLHALRDASRFEPWLRRLLVNACLDQLRKRRRRAPEIALRERHEPAVRDATGAILDRDQLAWAFERLTPDHRAVLVLTHFDGLSRREAAEALGIPIGTVKTRLHHALSSMRAAMDADARAPVPLKGGTA